MVPARIGFLRAGEAVMAARLQGQVTVVATIYSTTATRQITPAWRMRDVRTGEVYNVRSVIPSDDRHCLEVTAQRGVAT